MATRSRVGVGIGPPKVLGAPKPVSSVIMSRTFGAPVGAVTALGKSGVDSLALRPMTPPNSGSGAGRIAEPPAGGDVPCASAEFASPMQLTAAAITALSNKCLRTRMVASQGLYHRLPEPKSGAVRALVKTEMSAGTHERSIEASPWQVRSAASSGRNPPE